MDMNMETAQPNEPKSTALVPANILVMPKISAQAWADRITEASGEAVEKILVVGRLFLAANKALPHGQWQRLFKGHARAVENPVRFTVTTARMYMAVAQHSTLSNRNLGSVLPPSLSALYQLTFIPEPMLSQFIADGLITPNLTKALAMALRITFSAPVSRRRTSKQVIHQLKRSADDFDKLEKAQAILFRYATFVNEELAGPLQVGEDGRIQSGVFWLPDLPSPIKATPVRTKHTCECGHEHEDRR